MILDNMLLRTYIFNECCPDWKNYMYALILFIFSKEEYFCF